MRKRTVSKYAGILQDAIDKGMTLMDYCRENGLIYNNVISIMSTLRNNGAGNDAERRLIELYNRFVPTFSVKSPRVSEDRDDGGKIIRYRYEIPRDGKSPLTGILSRDEMETIHRLYSHYGDTLTQRQVSRHLADMSLRDLKRIVSAFGITKSSVPFAAHQFEEMTVDASEPGKVTKVLALSDIHVGAHNEPNGFLGLPEYGYDEITRRLNLVIKSIGKCDSIMVCNLGDSIDSYRKRTVRGEHELPSRSTDKENSELYQTVMLEFFSRLSLICRDVKYTCVGESNHDGDWGWLNNLLLAQRIKALLGIDSFISNDPIGKFDVGDVSFIYTHGKDNLSQKKPLPLTLNDKTDRWLGDWFLDSGLEFKKRRIILKGDSHQYAYTCAKHFDYVSCPSLYGSSRYIVSNFGKTPWGALVIDVTDNNIRTELIRD